VGERDALVVFPKTSVEGRGLARFPLLKFCVILLGMILGVQAEGLSGVPLAAWAEAPGPQIKSIRVQGNKRIEAPAIRARITLREGDRFSTEGIRDQIRAVYQMGFFEDVRVDTEQVPGGIAVIVIVTEKPFITDILFDGNEKVKDEKLREKLTVRNQSFLDQQQVKDSVERLRVLYEEEGHYAARIIPVIKTLDAEKKTLTFFIQEGPRARIKTVAFDGVKSVPVKKLKKPLFTRKYSFLFSWFDDSGIYKKEEVANDVERIRQVYLDEGYLNAQVGTPTVELSTDKKWFTIRFPVDEGPQFKLGKMEYQGQTLFTEPELRAGAKLKEGSVIRMAEVRDEVTRITDLYGVKGYAFAEVNPDVRPDQESKTAAVTFEVKEGALIHVRNINISGNEKTRDKVIRRELRLNEAELVDTAALKRSFQRLNNLNYFETVEIIPKQLDPNTVDLDVKVKEKSTGTFSIGGGFSSLDQLSVVADITEGNLFGRGQLLKIRGQLGQRRSLGVITFREPYLFDQPLSGQIDLYARETFFISYFERRIGGDVVLGKWFSEYLSGSVSLLRERLTISNSETSSFFLGGGGVTTTIPITDLPLLVQQQLGTSTTDAIVLGIARDTRDFYFDPKSGARHGLTTELAFKGLGADNEFYKVIGDTAWYFPVIGDTVFAPRARLGVAHSYGTRPLPVGERFFVGGIQTLRGFSFGRGGPVAPDLSPLGATKQLLFNFDFIFPLVPEVKVKGVVFFDYGKGFNDGEALGLNLRPAAGAGIRWISPFGPLRLEYGFNLSPRPGERTGLFEFSIGSLF
jgi:outer membrane protein insertion porin family